MIVTEFGGRFFVMKTRSDFIDKTTFKVRASGTNCAGIAVGFVNFPYKLVGKTYRFVLEEVEQEVEQDEL